MGTVAAAQAWPRCRLAIVALVGKAALLGVVVAVIDNSFAKLRLFKITEFASAAFLLAVLGAFDPLPGGWLMGRSGTRAFSPGARTSSRCCVLLAEFGMFRQALLRDQVRLYAAQSGLISVLAVSWWRRCGTCPSCTCWPGCPRR